MNKQKLLSIADDPAIGQSLSVFAQKQPVDYVNPLMGTDSKISLSNGNTYPAIALPVGDELLDAADRQNGRRLGIHVRFGQNPRLQADPPAQSLDQ